MARPVSQNAFQCSAGMLFRWRQEVTVWTETTFPILSRIAAAVPARLMMSACVVMGEHYASRIALMQGETHNEFLYACEMSSSAARLKAARIAARFETAPAAADAMGIPQQTYMAHENGSRGFTKSAERYAKMFKVTPQWLLFGAGAGAKMTPPPTKSPDDGRPIPAAEMRLWVKNGPVSRERRPQAALRSVPIMGEVAAGVWRETGVSATIDASESLSVDVPGYERAALWALRVAGPSMDLLYPPGRYVIVASPAEAGLRVGDHVVCERQQNGLIEITLKELMTIDGKNALMPRSSHPDYQEPFILSAAGDYDQTAPKIIGVVVADYARRERPPILFTPH